MCQTIWLRVWSHLSPPLPPPLPSSHLTSAMTCDNGWPLIVYSMGGVILPPQITIFAAMSEPLGISGRAFATFPECELATEWRFQTIFPTYEESNMATGKPEVLWNQYKLSLLVLQLKIKCQRLPPHFDYVRQRRHCPTSDDIRNPKIRPRKPEVEMTLGLFPLPISWPTFWVSDVGRCYNLRMSG